ncbi:MAG: SRPBCC domain-containing protein [Chitinophagales bacterium]|nr:SRPBCC domain-containing protein [Chitinophagales bacterium]
METGTYEIVSTRIFNHPLSKVYRAWTEPVLLAVWWGPKGFTNTFHEHDLRPGGRWLYTMHGPEKGNYENACTFVEIRPEAFLKWTRQSQPYFNVEVTFEPVSETQTRVVFKMVFDDAELRRKINNFAPEKNEENFDRLEGVLQDMVD